MSVCTNKEESYSIHENGVIFCLSDNFESVEINIEIK